jgi:conjugative transposon TraN protein
MKRFIAILAHIILPLFALAQNMHTAEGINKADLPAVFLPENVSLHFISPEPIQYVDISTKNIAGDLPLKNVLRIRRVSDTAGGKINRSSGRDVQEAVITIAGERFIVQYLVIFARSDTGRRIQTEIEIRPADVRPLDISGIGLSQPQLKNIAFDLITRKPGKAREHTRVFGIKGCLNAIHSLGDYLFVDLSFENNTQLKYDIDELRFTVDDKKVTRASNVQSVEISPEYVLFDIPSFKKYYRNIYVFRKLTFPGNKVLQIILSEKQLSGRLLKLEVPYQDVLDADIVPLN